MKWLEDKNGNMCSVEYFGSEEKAQEALDSLRDCRDCVNCSNSSNLLRCSETSNSSGCSETSNSSDCSDCSNCSACRHCSRCIGSNDLRACSQCSNCSNLLRCSNLCGYENIQDKKQEKLPIPTIKNLHKKVYEAASQKDSLEMNEWHTCGTKHCRGGWVVTLAGKQGWVLEGKFGTALAAMMIYDKNCPGYEINPCRFFDLNEDALEDMKRLAETEGKVKRG